MNSYQLSGRSLTKLQGVHPDLVRVVQRALQLSKVDFAVTEGVRTIERQAELVAGGASRTMSSRHITGHAVDLAPIIGGQISWAWPPFYDLADAMKKAAAELKVAVCWGGDWVTFRDGPHFELDRKVYP
jgi:hypothetical protein